MIQHKLSIQMLVLYLNRDTIKITFDAPYAWKIDLYQQDESLSAIARAIAWTDGALESSDK